MSGLNTNWTADSKSVLYLHLENDGHRRVYIESIDGTGRKPITPEGESYTIARGGVSPDGKFVIGRRVSDLATVLIPLDGSGAIQTVQGFKPGEAPRHWSSDGKSVFVQNQGDTQTGSQVFSWSLPPASAN